MKQVILAVTNDLHTDQRLHKVCTSLLKNNFDVTLVGRSLDSVRFEERAYKTKRFRLSFNKGFLFYTNFNIRLFWYLLGSKADIFVANDLDTIPAVYFASKIKRAKMIVDLHELFPQSPEIFNRRKIKKFWEFIEAYFLPKSNSIYTVCESIAEFYNEKFGLNCSVVRNVPLKNSDDSIKTASWPFPQKKQCILYQGAVNTGRGLQRLITSMQWIDAYLVIAGGGDKLQDLRELVSKLNLEDKIHFTGKIPFTEINTYTPLANLGISLEENLGLNYYFALPNKLFDYINHQIPVLVSPFPEMTRIVEGHEVGFIDKSGSAKELSDQINSILSLPVSDIEKIKANCQVARKVLNWEEEEKILLELYSNN